MIVLRSATLSRNLPDLLQVPSSVPLCLRGDSLPTILMHTHSTTHGFILRTWLLTEVLRSDDRQLIPMGTVPAEEIIECTLSTGRL